MKSEVNYVPRSLAQCQFRLGKSLVRLLLLSMKLLGKEELSTVHRETLSAAAGVQRLARDSGSTYDAMVAPPTSKMQINCTQT